MVTPHESKAVLSSNSRLKQQTDLAVASCGARGKARETAEMCVAHLYSSQWLDVRAMVTQDISGFSDDDEVVRSAVRDAFRECERVGLVPSGILGFLFYFAVRQAVWMVLEWVIREWLFSSDSETEGLCGEG